MSFLWNLFRSRLGILVPLIGICLLLLYQVVDSAPAHVAKFFAQQMETAPEKDVAELTRRISSLGKAGVPELVHGLASPRRAVVANCYEMLEKQFQQWIETSPKNASPYNYALAKTLLEDLELFGPTARLHASSFAERILRNMLVLENETYPRQPAITAMCEEILKKTEGERLVNRNPLLLQEMHSLTMVGPPSRISPADPHETEMMIAANTKNQKNQSGFPTRQLHAPGKRQLDHLEASEFFDPYSGPRAELLYVAQRSRTLSTDENLRSSSTRDEQAVPGPVPNALQAREMLAQRDYSRPRTASDFERDEFGAMQRSEPMGRIAAQYPPEHDLEEELQELPPYLAGQETSQPVPIEKTPLGAIAPEEIAKCSVAELMRLLQHPNQSVQAIAEKQLRKRQFRDEHIALAYRMHHPKPEMRRGMVEALARVPDVQPTTWLMEMLRDSDADVRLAAITFIATSKDKKLFQDILDRVRKDDDPRITSLINKLEKIQALMK